MRAAVIFLCVLDLAIGIAGVASTWVGQPDPQTHLLDQAWGVLLAAPLLVTALPAAILLWRGKPAKRALWFALAYPGAILFCFAAAAVLMFL